MELTNRTEADVTDEEWEALQQAAEVIEKAFGKRIYNVSLNPNRKDKEDVYSLSYTFNLFDKKEKK